jgi:hypothetical protein
MSRDNKFGLVCGDSPHSLVLLNIVDETIKGRKLQNEDFKGEEEWC